MSGLQSPPWVLGQSQHSAALFRQMPQGFLGGTGVINGLGVTQTAVASMAVQVAAGYGWMPGTQGSTTGWPANVNSQSGYGLAADLTDQGSYFGYCNGSETLSIAAADPSNPRIDIVCASVQDADYSGSFNQALLQVVTGTAAASPSAPSAPSNSLVLAQVAVAAGATSITNADITTEVSTAALAVGMVQNLTTSNLSSSAGILPSQIARFTPDIITSSGSVSIPTGAQYMRVMLQGGGGGGAGSYANSGSSSYCGGGGGGGGAWASDVISLSGVTSLTATIGAAGSAGAAAGNGGAGGNTTLTGTGLTTITAEGGAGGRTSINNYGGAYGAGSVNAFVMTSTSLTATAAGAGSGGTGAYDIYGTGTQWYASNGGGGIGRGGAGGGGGGAITQNPGTGGIAAYGHGGDGGDSGDSPGTGGTATGHGNGGGGGGMNLASGTQHAGGAGTSGIVIIEWL